MLRIVHPAPAGPVPRPSKGRRSAALSLTEEEAQHFRAALRNAARAYGGMPVLASLVGVPVGTLHQALRRNPSGGLALRVAKAAGMSVEALLSGQLSAAGRCPSCGSRIGERKAS